MYQPDLPCCVLPRACITPLRAAAIMVLSRSSRLLKLRQMACSLTMLPLARVPVNLLTSYELLLLRLGRSLLLTIFTTLFFSS